MTTRTIYIIADGSYCYIHCQGYINCIEFVPPFGSCTPSSGPVGSIIVMDSLFTYKAPIVISNVYL